MNKKNEYINKTLQRRQQEGFTLIELLAVITIMGILLLVAIPAISRTIENSRRDTFKTTAGNYATAIQNLVAADGLSCTVGSESKVISAAGDGVFVYRFHSGDTSGTDVMESGGNSSWGNSKVSGFVLINKKTSTGARKTINYDYYIQMCDEGKHGIDSFTNINGIGRSAVKTSDCTYNEKTAHATAAVPTLPTGVSYTTGQTAAYVCVLTD